MTAGPVMCHDSPRCTTEIGSSFGTLPSIRETSVLIAWAVRSSWSGGVKSAAVLHVAATGRTMARAANPAAA